MDRLKVSNSRFIESGRIVEAVDGTEGLIWKAVLIEAGMSANHRLYQPDVLRAAVPLFDGVRVFIDHPTNADEKNRPERSIRDITGWITEPTWDESEGDQGAVMGSLHLLESSSMTPLIREAYDRGKYDLYTLSIYGKGEQQLTRENGRVYQNVRGIRKIGSVDVVTEGAAGGRLVELMASIRKEEEMGVLDGLTVEEILEQRPDLKELLKPDPVVEPVVEPIAEVVVEPVVEPAPVVITTVVGPDNSMKEVIAELAALKEVVAISSCEANLNSKLTEAGLPDAWKADIRSRFAGRVFEDDKLTEAISKATQIMIDSKTEWEKKQTRDPRPQVMVVQDEKDKFVDALTATILGEAYNGVTGYAGIQQAYCLFHGLNYWDVGAQAIAASMVRESIGYDPILSTLAEGNISWDYVFGTAMNRVLVKDYRIPQFDEWKSVVSDIRSLRDFRAQRIERIGYYGLLPTVAAGGTYQETTAPADVEADYTPTKRGMLETWNWEDAINDDVGALRKIPRRLALAAKITLYQFVFNFINDNPACSYDGVALFIAAHNNNSTNELTSDNLTTAKIAMRDQTALSSTITFLHVSPKYILVPSELEATAIQIIKSNVEVTSDSDATIANPHKDSLEVISISYWTDDDKWNLVADPALIPTIEVGFLAGKQEPELFTEAANTGSEFTADQVAIKIRHVYGGAIVDHRGMYRGVPA